jgi:MFS family permease
MKVNPFVSLQFRNFRLLSIGAVISSVGSQMQIIGAIWEVYQLTHSPLSLGLVGAARIIPFILIAPLAGVVVDVLDRKKLMIITQSFQAVVALVFFIISFTHIVQPWMIYGLLMLISAVGSFDLPARQSFIPLLVPKKYLYNAFSVNILQWQTAQLLGPSLAGFLIAAGGSALVYGLNFISFFAIILALFLISPTKQQFEKKASVSFEAFTEGIRYIKSAPVLLSTMILDFAATFLASATTLLPIYADKILHVGPQGLGFLYAAPSLGAVIFGSVFSSFGEVKHSGKILLVMIAIFGLGTILFSISHFFTLTLFFLVLLGGSDAVSTILRNGIRQIGTPDYIRGRVSSVASIFAGGGPQLGEIEAGVMASLLGVQLSVAFGGVATILISLGFYFFMPKLRNYHGQTFEEKK